MRSYLLSRLRLQRRALTSTGLAVSLAVAFVVVVLGATATARQFIEDSAAPRARAASVVVTASVPTAGDFVLLTDKDAAKVRAVPGVAGVAVDRQVPMSVRWPDGVLPSGVDTLPAEPGLAWFTVVEGRSPAAAGEVLLDRRSAATLGIRPGSRLPVTALPGSSQPDALTVTGLYRTRGPQPTDRLVLAREADVLAWAGGSDGADGAAVTIREIDVLAEPGVAPEALADAVQAVVPKLEVRTSADAVDATVQGLTGDVDVLGRLVLGFTAIALVVAAIVISNTFTILLAQRARELALLRCVGASPRQLRRASGFEALALGLVASGVGVLLGALVLLVGGAVLAATVGKLDGLRAVLTGTAVMVPVLLGVLVTVLASVLPTRRATRVAPLAALRPPTVAVARRSGRVRLVGASLTALAGVLLLLAGLATGGEDGVPIAALGGVLLVVAVVIASPVLVPATTRLVGVPVGWFGPVARIAVGNTHRNATRSAATSTALFLGVCLISVLTVGAGTTVQAVKNDLNRSQPLDVALQTGAEGVREGGLPSRIVPLLDGVDGVVAVAGLRGTPVKTSERVKGRLEPVKLGFDGVVGGDDAAIRRVFRGSLPLADDVLLVPADDGSVAGGVNADPAGDGSADRRVELKGADGGKAVQLRVRAVKGLTSPLVSGSTLDRLGAGDRLVSVWARVSDDVDQVAVSDRISKAVRGLGLVGAGQGSSGVGQVSVSDFTDNGGLTQRAAIVSVMDTLLLASTGLLAVAVLISLAGIANTLSLSVLERTRESAVSRAIGMTGRQLRAGLAVEALLVAGVGCLLGVVVGVGLGWAGAATLLAGAADVAGPVVPPGRMLIVVGVALTAAVLASVLPGRRAVQVSPTQALAEA